TFELPSNKLLRNHCYLCPNSGVKQHKIGCKVKRNFGRIVELPELASTITRFNLLFGVRVQRVCQVDSRFENWEQDGSNHEAVRICRTIGQSIVDSSAIRE